MRAVSAWYSVLHKDAIPSLKWLSTKSDLSRAIKILNIMCGEHQPLTWWKFKVKLFKWYFCLFLSFLREKGLDSKRLRGRDINCRGSLSIDLIKEAGNFFLRAKILSACGMTETYSRLTFMTLYDLHFPFRYQPPIFMLEQISIQFKGHGPSELANMHHMLN